MECQGRDLHKTRALPLPSHFPHTHKKFSVLLLGDTAGRQEVKATGKER